MYEGFLALGSNDPFLPYQGAVEVVNNARAYAYAANANLCWLKDCDPCPTAALATPAGGRYRSPILDPAPWYNVDDPDSWGFLGVIGLDIEGAEASTRQSTVKTSVTGHGIFGPLYMGPRTLVVRAIVIASDECSLQFGLTWLRRQYNAMINPCGGDSLTFFDCCPCLCEEADEPVEPPEPPVDVEMCWPIDYDELAVGPPCVQPAAWWPLIYGEEKAGPPPGITMWWPANYGQEKAGTNTSWWPDNYGEEKNGPLASEAYWPDSYDQLIEGPAPDDPDWCGWVDDNEGITVGPDCLIQLSVMAAMDGAPCWPYNYLQFKDDPPCVIADPAIFWPDTYVEVVTGPPPDDPDWCGWPQVYGGLRTGPTPYTCCVQECVAPYVRQYHNTRVTEGPTVLSHPAMHSGGAVMEVEFTIVAADPQAYSLPFVAAGATWMRGSTLIEDEPEQEPAPNPWLLVGAS